MRKQPDWLEIQEYLYPQTILQKTLQIQAPGLSLPIHLSATFAYHAENRCIDITQSINDVISDNFSPGTYEVYAYWRDGEKYISLGVHPFKQPVTLSGELMESSTILLRVQSRGRRSGEKTVREILEKVGQWRKIYEKGKPKCTLEEAAKQVGVCKNTLQDYYIKIKLGSCEEEAQDRSTGTTSHLTSKNRSSICESS